MKKKSDLRRWIGLTALVTDAVTHGARAVERVHLATASRTFGVLEHVPVVSAPSRIVHVVHDAATSAVYATVRGVARVAGDAVTGGLRAWAARDPDGPPRGQLPPAIPRS